MTEKQEWRLLKDWNPQEGDVFETYYGIVATATSSTHAKLDWAPEIPLSKFVKEYTLVSRANQSPREFGELTDAEKGALLLAKYEGKRVEVFDGASWVADPVSIHSKYAYRIAPTRITGSVETDADGKPMFDTWEADQ